MAETVPESFDVERQNGEISIRWGVRKQVGDIALAGVLVALALMLCYVLGDQPSIVIVFGILLLGTACLLVARQFNHTAIQASSTRWIFKWGPVPARGPHVEWTRQGKTVDVAQLSQVFSLKAEQEEEEYRWQTVRGGSFIIGLLVMVPLNLIWAHLHAKNSARIRYDVFVMDKERVRRKVLSGLSGEQAAYLVQVLQPLLARGRSASEPTAAAQEDVSLQDHVAEPGPAPVEGVRTAAAAQQADVAFDSRSSPMPRELGSEDSEISCPACAASNPQDSDFCGECGAPLVRTAS